jgi:hypothetical protein
VTRNVSTTATVSTKFANVHQATWDGIATRLCAFHSVSMVVTAAAQLFVLAPKVFKDDTVKEVSKTQRLKITIDLNTFLI